MQLILDLLPDWGWHTGFEVVRDTLSLGLAGLGAYLAYLAIEFGKQQHLFAAEQERTARRQADIAEMQHQIMVEQLARRADLRCEAIVVTERNWEIIRFNINMLNVGTKTAAPVYWTLLIEYPYSDVVDIRRNVHDGERVTGATLEEDGRTFVRWEGISDRPVFPTRYATFVHLIFPWSTAANIVESLTPERLPDMGLKYKFVSEDGVFAGELQLQLFGGYD